MMHSDRPYFVRPAYRTAKGEAKLAIYYQADPKTLPDGQVIQPKPVPLVIAANYLDDPETVLKAIAAVLNGNG